MLQAGIGIQHRCQFTLYGIQYIDCSLHLCISRCRRTAGRLVHASKVEIGLLEQVNIAAALCQFNIFVDHTGQCCNHGISVHCSIVILVVQQICRNFRIRCQGHHLSYQSIGSVPIVPAIPRRDALTDQIIIITISQFLRHITLTCFQLIPPDTGGQNAVDFIRNFHIIDTHRYRNLHILTIDSQGSKAGICTGSCILNIQIHPNTTVLTGSNGVNTVGNGCILRNQRIGISAIGSTLSISGVVQIITILLI